MNWKGRRHRVTADSLVPVPENVSGGEQNGEGLAVLTAHRKTRTRWEGRAEEVTGKPRAGNPS